MSETISRRRVQKKRVTAQVAGEQSTIELTFTQAEEPLSPEEWLKSWRELSKDVSANWPKGVSAVDAIRDVRPDL